MIACWNTSNISLNIMPDPIVLTRYTSDKITKINFVFNMGQKSAYNVKPTSLPNI